MSHKLNRRDFLKASVLAAVGAAAASCAQPTPQVVEKEVPVEKVVKETVVVEKEVSVEKVVTATPVVMKYKEAPMLAGLVQSGKLPPVDERVGDEPMVITPWEEIGQYGGTWHRLAVSAGDVQTPARLPYGNLIRFDKDGSELVNNVVKAWEVNADNTEFTFHLRKGMKWSDGEPYTTDDIAFYFEDVMTDKDLSPSVNATYKKGGEVVKFAKLDAQTYKLTFVESYALFPMQVAGSNIYTHHQFPKHYNMQFHPKYTDKAALDKKAKDAGFEFWYQLYGNRCGGGSAWYGNTEFPVIAAWQMTVPAPKQPVVMERNPYYWKVDTEGNQLPYIDRIEHMLVQDAKTVNLRAVAGEVDMQMRHMTFDNYPLFMENREKGDYRILQWTRGYVTDSGIWFNEFHKDPVMKELLASPQFRKALSLGINRQEVIDAVYLGVSEPRQICPFSNSPFYWDEFEKYMIEHDPAKANEMLDAIGSISKRDAEGYRLRSDGKRLSIEFIYAPVFGAWGDIGQLLVAHWKELGIDLIVSEMARQLWEQRFHGLDFDMTMWTTDGTINPLVRIDWYAALQGANEDTTRRWRETDGKEGIEPTGEFAKMYALLDEFNLASTMDEWKRIFREMMQINMDNLWYIGICSAPPEVVVVKNAFRNVPEQAASDWQFMTPGNTLPEQYFIKQS